MFSLVIVSCHEEVDRHPNVELSLEINTTWSQSLILCHTARSVYEYFTWNLHVYVLYKYYILIKYYYM